VLLAAGRFLLLFHLLRDASFIPLQHQRLVLPPLRRHSLLHCSRCSSRFLFLRVTLIAITREGKHDADLSAGLSGDARNLLRLNCI